MMRARSLFLKIFLWYWVTVVLVGLALVVTYNLQPDLVVSRWRVMVGEASSLYAQAAAEELDRYGHTALDNYLQRLTASTKVRAAVFDENGVLISGKPSETTQDLATRAAHSNEPEFEVSPGRAYVARRVDGPSGRIYIFAAEMPRGPFGGLRASFRAQALRWAVSLLVSGLICYLLTVYLTAPILRLRTAARQLAAGNLSARASKKMELRRDEIGELVGDFNRMADRIEALVDAQKQLISDMSHELRSPLARLTVALGLARRSAGSEATGSLDRIERESERLNEMIGQLLTLARLGSASAPPEKDDINLAELLDEIVADASFEAQEHNCTVHLESAGPCFVSGTPELLRSAIENVVRNAIRYTAAHSEVEVRLDCSSGQQVAVVTVRDAGPGVPESEIPKLFQPFYRLANARERTSGGTGLGLAITDRAVRLHGGTVSARNAPNGGLIVEVRIPATAAVHA
jgi:two-component system sensor histidine kinase CpxA